jgi:hypothetical protein
MVVSSGAMVSVCFTGAKRSAGQVASLASDQTLLAPANQPALQGAQARFG